jgi:hypothetical protein
MAAGDGDIPDVPHERHRLGLAHVEVGEHVDRAGDATGKLARCRCS